MRKHYLVGMSGGVDSAVTAYLLKKQGHKVTAIFIKSWEDDDQNDYCATREDFRAAIKCADSIGIEIHHINFAQEYRQKVFTKFLDELTKARTPNPDILCNLEIKFKALQKHALLLGCDLIATGHYLNIKKNCEVRIFNAKDKIKDQSYFLYRLSQKQLFSSEFPLGKYTKTQIREIAHQAKIPSFNRKDSMGICFIGKRRFSEFLQNYLPKKTGDIINENGEIIGKHDGLAFYTIGQRQGLGIGGIKKLANPTNSKQMHQPWYLAKKDIDSNSLIAVQGKNHPWLWQKQVIAKNLHWLGSEIPKVGEEVLGKIRYRQEYNSGKIKKITTKQFIVDFDQPQWAVTSGQSLVIYRQINSKLIQCLGGGIIEN